MDKIGAYLALILRKRPYMCSYRVAGDLSVLEKKVSVLTSALTALCFNRPEMPRHRAEWLDGTYFEEIWSLFGTYFSKIWSLFGP